jgi:hypothetical protein
MSRSRALAFSPADQHGGNPFHGSVANMGHCAVGLQWRASSGTCTVIARRACLLLFPVRCRYSLLWNPALDQAEGINSICNVMCKRSMVALHNNVLPCISDQTLFFWFFNTCADGCQRNGLRDLLASSQPLSVQCSLPTFNSGRWHGGHRLLRLQRCQLRQ